MEFIAPPAIAFLAAWRLLQQGFVQQAGEGPQRSAGDLLGGGAGKAVAKERQLPQDPLLPLR